MIAAAVRSMNPRSGSSDHRKICDRQHGRRRQRARRRRGDEGAMPIISNGAVSPSAWAMPMIVPVMIPGSASGRTWWNTTSGSWRRRRRARLRGSMAAPPSTRRGRDHDDRQRHQASVRPPTPACAERGRSRRLRKTARPSRPNTIEGTAARLIDRDFDQVVRQRFGANSSKTSAARRRRSGRRSRTSRSAAGRRSPSSAPRCRARGPVRPPEEGQCGVEPRRDSS